MTKAQKGIDADELSAYSEHTYTAADIYGDASLLGRTDIMYEQASGQLEEIQRVDIFASPTDIFKNL